MTANLLRECLNALNTAPRFNYGPVDKSGRYGKPSSYDLARRLEEELARADKAGAALMTASNAAGCNLEGRASLALQLAVEGDLRGAAHEYAELARLLREAAP